MRLLANPNAHSMEYLSRRLLKLIEKFQDELCENPALLQWVLLHWDNIFYAGRICYGQMGTIKHGQVCEGNPKYELEIIKYNSPKNGNLIYDAWANTGDIFGHSLGLDISYQGSWLKEDFDEAKLQYIEIKDKPYQKLVEKPNKTLEEWYSALMNPKARYYSIYKDEFTVRSRVLCTGTSEYGWDENGYIANIGPSDTNKSYFLGWQKYSLKNLPVKMQGIFKQIISCFFVTNAIKKTKLVREEFVNKTIVSKATKDREILTIFNKEENWVEKAGFGNKTLDELTDLEVISVMKHWHRNIEFFPKDNKLQTYYPFYKDSTYNNIMNIPSNAHISYWKGSQMICNEIISNKELYSKEKPTIIAAKYWLKKHDKKLKSLQL